MNAPIERKASFRRMEDSTAEDWRIMVQGAGPLLEGLAGRVLDHFRSLQALPDIHSLDRYRHSLLTASLAHRDGQDEEYVVCALLHDMGDALAALNHADFAAAVLKPYVSGDNHWMVANHTVFQGYYYFHHLGMDRNMRDAYRGHPAFERTVEFCARYDQEAFDPDLDCMPIEAFVPMVQRVLAPERGRFTGN